MTGAQRGPASRQGGVAGGAGKAQGGGEGGAPQERAQAGHPVPTSPARQESWRQPAGAGVTEKRRPRGCLSANCQWVPWGPDGEGARVWSQAGAPQRLLPGAVWYRGSHHPTPGKDPRKGSELVIKERPPALSLCGGSGHDQELGLASGRRPR